MDGRSFGFMISLDFKRSAVLRPEGVSSSTFSFRLVESGAVFYEVTNGFFSSSIVLVDVSFERALPNTAPVVFLPKSTG